MEDIEFFTIEEWLDENKKFMIGKFSRPWQCQLDFENEVDALAFRLRWQ